MNNIPEKFLNEDGTVNTDALIKSYSEIEKKMGSMIRVPSDESDTEARDKFNRAIGVPNNSKDYPTNDLFSDESLKDKFLEIGLTPKQVEKIYNVAEEFLSPVLSNVFQSNHESKEITQLESFFGGKDKMTSALKSINDFGEKFLPTDAFESLCSSSAGIQSIYKMMQSVEPGIETQKNSSLNLSDKDLRSMMSDPKYWRDRDSEYIRKIETGFKKLYS